MRKSSKVILAAAVLTALILSTSAFAQAPSTLMYQGKLANASFIPITVETEVTFRIFDELEEGLELWMEVDTVAPNGDGVFTAQLGAEIPLIGVFNGAQRYLELQVTGDDPMTPRQLITSVPYSLQVNAPLIANSYRYGFYVADSLFPVTTQIDALTVNVPGDGYLVVELTGQFAVMYNGTYVTAWVCVTTTSGVTDSDSYVQWIRPASLGGNGYYYYTPVYVRKIIPVTAGSITVYANGYHSTGTTGDKAYLGQSNLSAIYYPSSMGEIIVTAPAGSAGDIDPRLQIVPGGETATSK